MPKRRPASNLTIKKTTVMRIDKAVPHDSEIMKNAKATGEGPPNWDGVYDVWFGGGTWHESRRGIEDPNVSVGIMIELLAASAIGRPSNSLALLFDDQLHYFCTRKDIFGPESRSTPPKAIRNGQLIKFAYREENEDHIKIVANSLNILGDPK